MFYKNNTYLILFTVLYLWFYWSVGSVSTYCFNALAEKCQPSQPAAWELDETFSRCSSEVNRCSLWLYSSTAIYCSDSLFAPAWVINYPCFGLKSVSIHAAYSTEPTGMTIYFLTLRHSAVGKIELNVPTEHLSGHIFNLKTPYRARISGVLCVWLAEVCLPGSDQYSRYCGKTERESISQISMNVFIERYVLSWCCRSADWQQICCRK